MRVSPRNVQCADDSGCPKDAEEGNAVAHAPQSTCTRRTHERSSHVFGRRVLRSVLRPVHVDPHYAPGASLVVGHCSRHHGWANPRKWEEPALGQIGVDVARLAACHSSMQVEGRGTERKGRRSRPPSLRGSKSPGWVARTSYETLQKSVGGVWPRISSANALQKERSGSSERGPSSERRSAGDTVGSRVERRVRREVGLTAEEREDRRKTQGGARVPFSGYDIAKSGAVVAGPGR